MVGNQTRVKVVKNSSHPVRRSSSISCTEAYRRWRVGRSRRQSRRGGKSGSWFSYESQRIGQGRENAKTFLKGNPDMAAKIEAAVRANSGLIAEKILAGEKDKDTDDDDADEAAEE